MRSLRYELADHIDRYLDHVTDADGTPNGEDIVDEILGFLDPILDDEAENKFGFTERLKDLLLDEFMFLLKPSPDDPR